MKKIALFFYMVIVSAILNAQRPFIGGYNVYYGHLHNHSDVSDGKGSPASAYNYAKNTAKLDFFSLADHCYSITASEWTDIKNQANAFNEDGIFTAFWGFEWSSNRNWGHITVINTDDYCTVTNTAYNEFTELVTWLSTRNGVAFFNHPGREDYLGKEFSHFSTTPSEKFVGMELWNNSKAFSVYYYNDGYFSGDNNKSYFDEVNSRGWRIGASGASDNHGGTWGTDNDYRMAVLSNNLTRSDLFEAIQARRFYSTLDKNLALSFKINGQEMGSELEAGTYTAQIEANDGNGEFFREVKMFDKNHNVVNTWVINTSTVNITYILNTSSGDYFYVKVKQADGNEAISSPIWISGGTSNQQPECYITNPANNASFDVPANITISADAFDTDGNITKVEFYQGSTKLGEVFSSPYNYDWNNVSSGTYSLSVKATDNSGAVITSDSVFINVMVSNTENTTVIGNTDIYGNTIKWGAQLAIPVTFTESGEITSVSIYHDGGTGNMLLGVYSDQGGFPSSRLGITATTLVSASAGWQTIQLSTPVPVVTGQKVWLSWVFQNTPAIRYTSGTPGRAASSNNWANQMPSAFGTSTIASTKYSIYCTYATQGSPTDIIAPVVKAFSIPATSSTLTVPVSSFTATDNVGVTGYLVTESSSTPLAGDAGWSATAPASYDFATAGTKMLYAWAKDAAGNISVSMNVQVIITLPGNDIGNTDIYGNTIKWGAQLAMPVTFTESGEITSVSIYHDGGTGNMLLGVYSDQGGFPSSRLGITATTLVSASAGWQTIQLSTPVPVVTGQKVWLSWVFQNTPAIRYTAGTPGRAASSNNWANQMPSVFGASTIASNKYSIYCTYTVNTKSAEIATAIAPEIEFANLKVYPNPFSEKLRFEFVSPESVNARIDLYDMTGRMVKTIFEQSIEGGVSYEAEFIPEAIISGMYIYRMVMGEAVYNGKVVFEK
jgi:hypothetical protein